MLCHYWCYSIATAAALYSLLCVFLAPTACSVSGVPIHINYLCWHAMIHVYACLLGCNAPVVPSGASDALGCHAVLLLGSIAA